MELFCLGANTNWSNSLLSGVPCVSFLLLNHDHPLALIGSGVGVLNSCAAYGYKIPSIVFFPDISKIYTGDLPQLIIFYSTILHKKLYLVFPNALFETFREIVSKTNEIKQVDYSYVVLISVPPFNKYCFKPHELPSDLSVIYFDPSFFKAISSCADRENSFSSPKLATCFRERTNWVNKRKKMAFLIFFKNKPLISFSGGCLINELLFAELSQAPIIIALAENSVDKTKVTKECIFSHSMSHCGEHSDPLPTSQELYTWTEKVNSQRAFFQNSLLEKLKQSLSRERNSSQLIDKECGDTKKSYVAPSISSNSPLLHMLCVCGRKNYGFSGKENWFKYCGGGLRLPLRKSWIRKRSSVKNLYQRDMTFSSLGNGIMKTEHEEGEVSTTFRSVRCPTNSSNSSELIKDVSKACFLSRSALFPERFPTFDNDSSSSLSSETVNSLYDRKYRSNRKSEVIDYGNSEKCANFEELPKSLENISNEIKSTSTSLHHKRGNGSEVNLVLSPNPKSRFVFIFNNENRSQFPGRFCLSKYHTLQQLILAVKDFFQTKPNISDLVFPTGQKVTDLKDLPHRAKLIAIKRTGRPFSKEKLPKLLNSDSSLPFYSLYEVQM